eukprot:1425115-Rhodomonas_salina.2
MERRVVSPPSYRCVPPYAPATTCLAVSSYAPGTTCSVLTDGMVLRQYSEVRCEASLSYSSAKVAYHPTPLLCALSGTGRGCTAIVLRVTSATMLYLRYALSGTDMGCTGTRGPRQTGG